MGNKQFLSFFIFILCGFSVYALNSDELLQKAYDNSNTAKILEIDRQNNKISKEISEDPETVSVSVSSGDVTFRRNRTDNLEISVNPKIEISIPDKDKNDNKETVLQFSLEDQSNYYQNGKNTQILTPAAQLSTLISMNGYDSVRKNLTEEMSDIQQEQSYQRGLLQFYNGVLNDTISLMESSLSLKSLQRNLERTVADYQSDIVSGDITANSLKDMQVQMNIESSKISFQNQTVRHDVLLANYKQNYGFEYEPISEVREVNPVLVPQPEGNTNVKISNLLLQVAQLNLESKLGTDKTLRIGTNLSSPITIIEDSDTTVSLDGSAYARLVGENYSFGASVGATYNKMEEIYPYVTLSGSWSNKKAKNTDNLEIQTLRNKVVLAEMDYDNAVYNYNSDVKNLLNEIDDYQNQLSQLQVRTKYNSMILERKRQLYSMGLITMRDIQDAEYEEEKDRIEKIVMQLKGIVLQNKIDILQL